MSQYVKQISDEQFWNMALQSQWLHNKSNYRGEMAQHVIQLSLPNHKK